jgi:hypothetical protein
MVRELALVRYFRGDVTNPYRVASVWQETFYATKFAHCFFDLSNFIGCGLYGFASAAAFGGDLQSGGDES